MTKINDGVAYKKTCISNTILSLGITDVPFTVTRCIISIKLKKTVKISFELHPSIILLKKTFSYRLRFYFNQAAFSSVKK